MDRRRSHEKSTRGMMSPRSFESTVRGTVSTRGPARGRGVDKVVIVEDEEEIVVHPGDLAEQSRQDGLRRLRPGGVERGRRSRHDVRRDLPQGGHEVEEETCGIAVALVERQPGCRPPARRDPFSRERGLAVAGWRGDERQPAALAPVQTVHQSGVGTSSGPDVGTWSLAAMSASGTPRV